MSVDREELKT